MALCPNCHKTVVLSAASCQSCGAVFGDGAWRPIPDRLDTIISPSTANSSNGGPTSAFEHYARLSDEDLKGLLQAQVLSNEDAEFVSQELQRRGDRTVVLPSATSTSSPAQAAGEFFMVLTAFVVVMSFIGRSGGLAYLFMFLSIFVSCFVLAVLASRIVPKYRSLPYSNLVLRTTRVLAVLGVLMAFGLWYGQRHN